MEQYDANHFPAALRALLTPAAYPHPVNRVALLETHISWVLLTGDFAYKIKRPVHYPFIDMGELDRRAFLCREELRVNRRFAPRLYLGVCPITSMHGAARIRDDAGDAGDAGDGEIIEYAVRMRQFDRDAELDRLLLAGRIETDELAAFGRRFADIHAELPAAGAAEPWGHAGQIGTLILQNLSECAASGALPGSDQVTALRAALEQRLQQSDPWLLRRRADGRVRECHGDLHCRNIVRYGADLRAFDAMEFEPAFRWVDVADDIALLIVDLEARGHPEHAHAFLNAYLARGGDYQGCRVLDLYKAHRALVRAKVAGLQARGMAARDVPGPLVQEQARLVDCAARALEPRMPQMLLMCGVAGSGKSWLAQRLAPRLRALLLRSDVERKRRAGLGAHAHSGSALNQDLYAPEVSADLYRHLARCAQDILSGGYSVIVDASFMCRAERARFHRLAVQLGADVRIIHCQGPRALLHERVLRRQHSASDESEAGVDVLAWQLTHFETILADENMALFDVESGAPGAIDEIVDWCATPAPSGTLIGAGASRDADRVRIQVAGGPVTLEGEVAFPP